MTELLNALAFSFSVTGPIFVVLLLGVGLMRIGLLNDNFVDTGARLVFNVALPALLFISISKTRFEAAANVDLILFGLVGTLLLFIALEWVARRWVATPSDRGVFVQGCFRSNMGIIGLAYCVNAYGEAGLVAASLYLGIVTILFNVLAVITLSRSLGTHQSFGRMLKGIARNPLIIGIVLALPVSWAGIELPALVRQSGQYFANLTLPLALLCTGAALDFGQLRRDIRNTLLAGGIKLVAVPLLFVAAGLALGFRGVDLGVLLLMSGAPTAAASYVMVRAMGGNAALAANIIAVTTLGSILTTSLGVLLLRTAGLM
ncbi:AEC family transporter [Denitromonas iodatirespirans]|uniref:AEC family transporter n=1 Tax=Denitromonas iodatirespirans TaxID=2795389 RepID=A0A944DCN4_DENI1|nr:AEC family transporter [Denitromonas iodatirespirans]MBT0962023.1 AEC family transporter [Denitromonas iodatirespirans]